MVRPYFSPPGGLRTGVPFDSSLIMDERHQNAVLNRAQQFLYEYDEKIWYHRGDNRANIYAVVRFSPKSRNFGSSMSVSA